jgi:multidrug efflux pump subunit AcrB
MGIMENRKGVIFQTIKRKALTIAMIGFIFIMGIWSYSAVPKQEYPVIQAPAVNIPRY